MLSNLMALNYHPYADDYQISSPEFPCRISTYFPNVYSIFPTWMSNRYIKLNMSKTHCWLKSFLPLSLYYFSVKIALFYQRLTTTIWKTLLVTLLLFKTHIYSTDQQILPSISINTTSSAHVLTYITTISHTDYDRSLYLCPQFILNTATRVILLKHKSIILSFSKSSNGFPILLSGV